MIGRLGFLVAASIAAYAVRQVNTGRPAKPAEKPPDDDAATVELRKDGEDIEELFRDFEVSKEKLRVEEEEEKVNRINSETDLEGHGRFMEDEDDDDDEYPEFEEFFAGEIDFPYDEEKYDEEKYDAEANAAYEIEMATKEAELERLRTMVKELEERESKLEGELLEYYGLKEQESDIAELQRQLKMKQAEIDVLNATINSLQAERKKLHEEVTSAMLARKELEVARHKIKELQRQIELDAKKTKGQLLMLKQQVTGLQTKEVEATEKDAEIARKLKAMKDLEVEVVELRRKNKELQHEKRELIIKLDVAEAKATDLSDTSENEMIAKAREDISRLRHANEDLTKQVEGLQMNRFSEVEELVYLRWVNACLRYELRNYQMPPGRVSARDLSKNLSPRSQEKAKRLMLEYAGSERGQGDTDLESISSMPSSPGSDDDNVSIDSSSSRLSSLSKKLGIMQKLKRWGKSKDDSGIASPARSFGFMLPKSPAVKGPLEQIMLRNASDNNAITTFGKREEDPNETGVELSQIKTQGSPDSLNNVAASFQLMSKTIEGVAMDKYPAYKDRHKLALEREHAIKEKAEQARAERFGDASSEGTNFVIKARERALPLVLPPPRLTQIKSFGGASANSPSDSNQQSNDQSNEQSNDSGSDTPVVSKMKLTQIEKRAPRVPRPPPTRSGATSNTQTMTGSTGGPPPPPPLPPGVPPPPPALPGGPPRPPPPPGDLSKGTGGGKVYRAPELVEFYQSLMKRENKKDPLALTSSPSNAVDAKSNMIGEIANKSAFLLAVKADVETQGEFVQSLAAEVRAASFTSIGELVSFVNWLDEELSFLVDERAVLKHFDWPEGKADALREAAFEYQDLAKLENQVSSFVDDLKLSVDPALKKMYSLLEKVEQSVYALLRTRDMAISRYRDFGFPVDWLMDSGIVGKIKLASVQLARKYMKRVSSELDALTGKENEPAREFLILQGVRFAFRVHQFAGGFDAESMRAFEELRSRVNMGGAATDKPQA